MMNNFPCVLMNLLILLRIFDYNQTKYFGIKLQSIHNLNAPEVFITSKPQSYAAGNSNALLPETIGLISLFWCLDFH